MYKKNKQEKNNNRHIYLGNFVFLKATSLFVGRWSTNIVTETQQLVIFTTELVKIV